MMVSEKIREAVKIGGCPMLDPKLTPGYTCIQSFFWMGYAVVMGFVSLYLLNAGFTSGQVGAIIAVAGLISAVLQPSIAGLADKPKGPALRTLVLCLAVALLAGSFGLLALNSSKLLTGLVYGICITLLQSTTSLVSALGVTGKRLPNFGLARGLGSIAYASVALGLGYLADWFGALSIPVAMAFSFALMTVTVFLYPAVERDEADAAPSGSTPAVFFRRYPRFAIVLAGTTLLFVSHVLLNSFTFQIVSAKGGGSGEMGASMALSALIEIPTMVLFSRMLKAARCHVWFRISGVFFMLKTLGTLLVTTVAGFFAVQLFQLLGWGLITVSAVYYINAIMAPEDAVKGQAYYTVTLTLGNVFGAVIGGRIIDTLGVNAMLIFGTVCALIGALILIFFSQKTETV